MNVVGWSFLIHLVAPFADVGSHGQDVLLALVLAGAQVDGGMERMKAQVAIDGADKFLVTVCHMRDVFALLVRFFNLDGIIGSIRTSIALLATHLQIAQCQEWLDRAVIAATGFARSAFYAIHLDASFGDNDLGDASVADLHNFFMGDLLPVFAQAVYRYFINASACLGGIKMQVGHASVIFPQGDVGTQGKYVFYLSIPASWGTVVVYFLDIR